MGLRVWWRRHPVWWGCAAIIILGMLTVLGVACWERHRGLVRLQAVQDAQRVAGLGCAPADFLVLLPPHRDAALQQQAYALFGMNGRAIWTKDFEPTHTTCIRDGAAWQPDDSVRDLLKADAVTASSVRSLLDDPRLVLSTAAWVVDDQGHVRDDADLCWANPIDQRQAAEHLALEFACGDPAALDYLDRLERAYVAPTTAIDLNAHAGVQQTRDDAYLAGSIRGVVSRERAASWLAEPATLADDLRIVYRGVRLVMIDPFIRAARAGRRVERDVRGSTNVLGVGDWIHGPGVLADNLEQLACLEQGRMPAPGPLPAMAKPLFQRMLASDWTMRASDWEPTRHWMLQADHRRRLAHLAARLVIDCRAGLSLPAEAGEVCDRWGDAQAFSGATDRVPLVYHRISLSGFAILPDPAHLPGWLQPQNPATLSPWRVHLGDYVKVDLDPSPVTEAKR
jgi:hypothetical protein